MLAPRLEPRGSSIRNDSRSLNDAGVGVGVELAKTLKSVFQRSIDFHLRDREIRFADDLGRKPGRKREDPCSDLDDDRFDVFFNFLDRDELFALLSELDLFQFRLDREQFMSRLVGGRGRDRSVAVFRMRAFDELALQVRDVPSKTLRDVVASGFHSRESAFLEIVDVAFADVQFARDVCDFTDPGRSFRADLFASCFFLLRVSHGSLSFRNFTPLHSSCDESHGRMDGEGPRSP